MRKYIAIKGLLLSLGWVRSFQPHTSGALLLTHVSAFLCESTKREEIHVCAKARLLRKKYAVKDFRGTPVTHRTALVMTLARH